MPERAEARPIRVIAADDSYVVREFLAATLQATPEVELVAVCSNGNELEDALESHPLDVLIIVEATDRKLDLAARNLPHVEVIEVGALNPVCLAAYDKVLMTVGAVKMLEERLQ